MTQQHAELSPSATEVRHITTVNHFDLQFIQRVFERAKSHQQVVGHGGRPRQTLDDIDMLNLFFEPSTRTMESFTLAARKLGAFVETTVNARQYSSYAKNESDADAARTYAAIGYGTIVVRHDTPFGPHNMAEVSPVPIINAGDGNNEHPTQTLLDLFTVFDHHADDGDMHNKTILFGGDARNGRTVRSLATTIARHFPDNKLIFGTHPNLTIDNDLRNKLSELGVDLTETDSPKDFLGEADVVYWTRTQAERGSAVTDDERYIILPDDMSHLKPNAIVMHPLPRVSELLVEPEQDPRVIIFDQVRNGRYVRMALLEWVNNVF